MVPGRRVVATVLVDRRTVVVDRPAVVEVEGAVVVAGTVVDDSVVVVAAEEPTSTSFDPPPQAGKQSPTITASTAGTFTLSPSLAYWCTGYARDVPKRRHPQLGRRADTKDTGALLQAQSVEREGGAEGDEERPEGLALRALADSLRQLGPDEAGWDHTGGECR